MFPLEIQTRESLSASKFSPFSEHLGVQQSAVHLPFIWNIIMKVVFFGMLYFTRSSVIRNSRIQLAVLVDFMDCPECHVISITVVTLKVE